jgi:hypothetical protein
MPHHAQHNHVVLDRAVSKNFEGWPAPKKIIWRPEIHKMGCPARGHLHPTDWPRRTVSANFGVSISKKIEQHQRNNASCYFLLPPYSINA